MQFLGPGEFGPRTATIEIERGEAELGKGMAGEVGLGKENQAGNASGRGKHMPQGLPDDMQLELGCDLVAKRAQANFAGQKFGGATESVDQPFRSAHHEE